MAVSKQQHNSQRQFIHGPAGNKNSKAKQQQQHLHL